MTYRVIILATINEQPHSKYHSGNFIHPEKTNKPVLGFANCFVNHFCFALKKKGDTEKQEEMLGYSYLLTHKT